MKALGAAFGSGVLFAVGLGVAGMTHPSKVIGFLDVGGDWDPSLALVMASGLAVHAVAQRWARRRGRPFLAERFPVHPAQIDGALIGGAALFGIGWGAAGYCPGPGLLSAFVGVPAGVGFVVAMLGGMGVYRVVNGVRGDETGGVSVDACG